MRLTQTHAEFWAWHKAPACLRIGKAPDVNEAVNAHCKWSGLKVEPGNTFNLLRSARKRGQSLTETLSWLSKESLEGTRRVWVRRWQRRLNKEGGKATVKIDISYRPRISLQAKPRASGTPD